MCNDQTHWIPNSVLIICYVLFHKLAPENINSKLEIGMHC